jgi:hypothetical protein
MPENRQEEREYEKLRRKDDGKRKKRIGRIV